MNDSLRNYLKGAARDVIEQTVGAWFVSQSGETPTWAKAGLAAAIAYVVLPTDAVPDFLPFIGWADDAAVLATALRAAQQFITATIEYQATEFLKSKLGI